MPVSIKTTEEIKILREGGKRLAAIRDTLASRVVPGVSAQDIEDAAKELFAQSYGEPSFLNYKSKKQEKPFPARVCVSVNDAVVHGLPSREVVFREGDVVGIDVGLKYQGLFTDTAVTVSVGTVSTEAQKLLEVTKKSLDVGIAAVRAGATVGDIGFAVEQYVKSMSFPPASPKLQRGERKRESRESGENLDSHLHGNDGVSFGIIRTLAGHGVGYAVHEEPHIPNFGKKGEGIVLKKGMVIAIEPMLTLGGEKLVLDPDGFTFRTADGSLSAHFEHTVAVTKEGAEILTQM